MKTSISILLVDDDAAFRQVMAGELRRLGYELSVASSGEEALQKIEESEPRVVLLDLRLPGMDGLEVLKMLRETHPLIEVILMTGHGSIDTAIEAIRLGAFDYVLKPCPLAEVEIRIQRAVERGALRHRTKLLERGLMPSESGVSFLGNSPEFRKLVDLIDRVAPSDSTVLIQGETGSGKERIAKLIHARSLRKSRPFVVVECAAIQETLLQSELFGHERGSFTGADRAKPGLFEVADGGTIFLDEIGEVSMATQVSLLRALDTSTFRRVGGTKEIHVDVRVIAATNRDLSDMVRQKLFREDLFYRLSTITVEALPLRKRPEDVELLCLHFLQLMNERLQSARHFSPSAMQLLRGHNWPGNVRELRHAVEAAAVVCAGNEIGPEHLPSAIRPHMLAGIMPTMPESGRFLTLEELEAGHIRAALEKACGHRGSAARLLGISERNLYRKLREYGLLV